MNQLPTPVTYSAVIPVYNSAPLVGQTIDRCTAFFESQGWDYEIILVNDGSSDSSWDVLRQKAQANPRVLVVNLLHNYGQHTAIFCGLQQSRGDYVITLDDDLQNPPQEIAHLVEKAAEGDYDLVLGRFRGKKHAAHRRMGSRLIATINRRVFHQPRDLVMTNFRLIRRDVVDRICSYRTNYPYITGLALMFSVNRANVWVEHHPRPVGKSNYDIFRILSLVMRILFNYSSFPLRMVSLLGLVVAGSSLLLGLYYLVRGILGGIQVPGWTTVVVLLAFFNGLIILSLSMIGEYLIRLVNQASSTAIYHIKESINLHG